MKTANRTFILGVCLFMLTVSTRAFAGDLDSAKRSLDKVKEDIDSNSWSNVDEDIKATEEFLDGLPDADRLPIQKELDDLKPKAAAGVKANKSGAIIDSSNRKLDLAADDMATAPGNALDTINEVIQTLNGDDAKKYLDPDQLAKLQGRATSLQKMAVGKSADMKIANAAPIIKELDDTMASQPFKDAKSPEDVDHVSQNIESLMSRIRGQIEGTPADDPRVKAINDKLATYTQQMQAATGAAGQSQAAANLANQWKAQQDYFAGWDQETQGPSWQDFTHKASQEMSNLLMPKTVELLTRLNYWFADDNIKATAQQYKDDASVKATMAEAHKDFDAAAAKIHKAINSLLDEADKIDTPKDSLVHNAIDSLQHDADMWLKNTPYHDDDVARAKKIADKWSGAIAGDAAAKQALLEKMTKDADANWPGIASSITAEDGFTPDKIDEYKGKIIHLKGNNRLGWDYNPVDYNYARSINGMAVAGRFTPEVRDAFFDAQRKTGQDISDEAWDLFAVVQGPGKIDERTSTEGKVTVDGDAVGTYKEEGHKTVDCAIVQIFALHAGPVAIGSAGGASAAAAGGGVVHTIFNLFLHLIELAICAVAAGLVMIKSRPALATQVAGPDSPAAAINQGDNLAFAGLAIVVLGVLWMIFKLILGDFLPAAALTLCGVYIASDWLVAKKILPTNLAATLKPLALPIAGATALFGLLHLFLAHWYLF